MTSYDNMQGSEQDADSHEENSHNYTQMAGDLRSYDFTQHGDYTKAGPSASNPVEQTIKILAAPRTDNVLSIKTGNKIR